MATRVRSYSKINLGLAIGPVRADGFHGLATLYQTLALHDVVTVEAQGTGNREQGTGDSRGPTSQKRDAHPSQQAPTPANKFAGDPGAGRGPRDVGHPTPGESRITLTTNHPQVPADERNTAWKMVARALQRMGVAAEVKIHIEKELPVQGGLGAGSANAAAALLGLERELGMALPEAERMELAAEVGSDVPLFLVGGAVLGLGRGEVVSPMPDLPATWCVVAVPEVGVSTPRAFQEWDGLCRERGSGNREQGGAEEDPGLKPPAFERGYRGLKPAATPGGRPPDTGQETGDCGRGSLFPDPCSLPPGLTSPAQPDRLEELSHVYASVFGGDPWAEQTSDTSGIVGHRQGLSGSETKQGGLGEISKTSEQGSAPNDLAGNILLALVRTGIENDFEQVVFSQVPLLREIKHELMGPPADGLREGRPDDSSGKALYVALSGSGSALFGLYRSEADARAAQLRVQAFGCKAILTETLPRREYWRTMFAE
jgi:4-diphosphocytidyl-2-C-methyl-D-erythritol kinase